MGWVCLFSACFGSSVLSSYLIAEMARTRKVKESEMMVARLIKTHSVVTGGDKRLTGTISRLS